MTNLIGGKWCRDDLTLVMQHYGVRLGKEVARSSIGPDLLMCTTKRPPGQLLGPPRLLAIGDSDFQDLTPRTIPSTAGAWSMTCVKRHLSGGAIARFERGRSRATAPS